MKKCAGFITDLLSEREIANITESIWDEDQPDPIAALGLSARRCVMLQKYAQTLVEQEILKVFAENGDVKDAAAKIQKTDRRVRQIVKAFLVRLATQSEQKQIATLTIAHASHKRIEPINQIELML